jgi:hypothetical protein
MVLLTVLRHRACAQSTRRAMCIDIERLRNRSRLTTDDDDLKLQSLYPSFYDS